MRNIVDIRVWGDYACFTRPEFKVERVSYPVMTPSAARGTLEAIYWKPQIRYRIQRIGILRHPCLKKEESPIGREWSLLRNEISSRQNKNAKGMGYAFQVLADPEGQVKKPGKGKNKAETAEDIARRQFILIDEHRQQRTSLVLKDVAYRIQAWIEPRNGETNIAKHLDCFRRRAERGQYFHKPFLGCREFAADFEWLGGKPDDDKTIIPPHDLFRSIGTMLFDTAYIENPKRYAEHSEDRLEFWRHENDEAREAKGYAKRLFFNAEVKNGWLVEKDRNSLPDSLYDELTKLEAGNGNH
ncbi:MAG: CRISPR-associated protein Cas5 [Deltaproteobacteria bacterium]|nr:CRISPR-associated protein Cas5 [Deltaproteobacteria bacterium]